MGEWTEDKKGVKSLSIDLQKEKMTVEVKERHVAFYLVWFSRYRHVLAKAGFKLEDKS